MIGSLVGWELVILDASAPSLSVEDRRVTLELVSPGPQGPSGAAASVTSVNGQDGAVVLGAADVGAAATVHGHSISDVSGLQTALAGKASAIHGHAISDVSGLQGALDGKAASVHTHTASQISDSSAVGRSVLTAADAAAARSALSAAASSHGHAIADVTGLQAALDGKAATSHTHGVGDVTGLGTAATRNAPAAGNAGSAEVVLGSDSRLTDSRAPSGTAGGALAGSYPNPTIAPGAVGYAAIQNVTPQRLLGNPGVGAAAPSEIPLTSPLQFSGGAVQINWPGSASGQVFYRSGTTITASTKLVFDATTTTFTLNNGTGDIISMSPFGLFAPLMTLGDVAGSGTNVQIDDGAQTITVNASTFNIDGNTIGAYTANAYFSTVTAGTFSGGFGEYFTNPANGVVEIGPDGTSSTQQALTLTYNSVADWIRFGTKRKSDGNTTSGIFYFDRPLYMATGTEQQWGGWYTASAQSSAKACFTIGLLSGAQVSGSSGSMVLVTNNQKGSSNRVPTTAHTDPTLYLYAYDQSLGTISNDYLRMWHNVTNANIESGRGDLNLITPSGSNVKANGSTLATQAFAIIQAVALA